MNTPMGTPVVIEIGTTAWDAERQLIEATLKAFITRERAAVVLGISVKTLYNRMKRYERDDAEASAAIAADLKLAA